jgi:hypothetical protein
MPSGSSYCVQDDCGIFYWGAHAHDAIWHFAIVAASFVSWPLTAPTFSGEVLYGYNFLLDVVLYVLSLVGVPVQFSYFKILPPVWFVLFTVAAIELGRMIGSRVFVKVLLFFLYFGGSFSYFLTLFHDRTIWGSAALLSMQAGLTLTNVQFAFSLIILLAFLRLAIVKKVTLKNTYLLGGLLVLALGMKFYGGVIALIFSTIYLLLFLVRSKNVKQFLLHSVVLGVCAGAAIIIFYNPSASLKTGSVLSFSPLSIVHPLIEEKGLLYMEDTVNARYFLEEHGIGPRLIAIEAMTLFLFIFFNLGTRFFGLLYGLGNFVRGKIKTIDLYLLTGTVVAILLTILFVQKGQWWNTIQFFYYASFLTCFYSARLVSNLFEKKEKFYTIIGIFLLLLTIPNSLDVIKEFSSYPAHSYMPVTEQKALTRLKRERNGIVYIPIDNNDRDQHRPNPLNIYEDNAYVTAFTGKQAFFADLVQLQLTGIAYERRLARILNGDCSILKEVDYVYKTKTQSDLIIERCVMPAALPVLYTDQYVEIYKTR